MQVFGLAGVVFAVWYSLVTIMGAGMGSPTGKPHDSYYVRAGWMLIVPALVFLAGWIWVTVAYLCAPCWSRSKARSEKEQRGLGV
jgi:hypothetical protein